MAVSSATSHRVLAACLIVTGGIFLVVCGLEVLLVFLTQGLDGMGNPTAESMQEGKARSETALVFAGSVGLIGVTLLTAGFLWWPRKRA